MHIEINIKTMSKIKNYEEYEQKTYAAAELFNKGDYKNALKEFLILAAYNNENYKVHETLSIIYLKLNDLTNAQKEYDIVHSLLRKKNKSLLEKKSFEEVISSLSDISTLEGQYQKELESNSGKKSTALPIQISMHHINRGNYHEAEKVLTRHKKEFFEK